MTDWLERSLISQQKADEEIHKQLEREANRLGAPTVACLAGDSSTYVDNGEVYARGKGE